MIGEFKHIANVIQIYSEKLIKSLADVEAFDESWNGSPEPYEPERHWKLFRKRQNASASYEIYPVR